MLDLSRFAARRAVFVPSLTELREGRSRRLGLSRHLRNTASALALGLIAGAAVLTTVVQPAAAEWGSEAEWTSELLSMTAAAGSDGILTETDLRNWITRDIANNGGGTSPTEAEINAFIDSNATTGSGGGERQFTLDAVTVAMSLNALANEGSGPWDGTGEISKHQKAPLLWDAAGSDGVLSEAEFRALIASLPANNVPSAADLDRMIADLRDAGGNLSITSILLYREDIQVPPAPAAPGPACNGQSNATVCRMNPDNRLGIWVGGAGDPIAVRNDVAITTTRDRDVGISIGASSYGSALPELFLFNTAAITTQGFDAVGIEALSYRGNLTISNTGAITTTNASGMRLLSNRGPVTVFNEGAIGASWYGIEVVSPNDGNISIANSGAIATTTFNAIRARTVGGDVFIDNSGALTSQGYAAAIDATGVNVDVRNSGAITSNQIGISVSAEGGNATLINSGNVNAGGSVAIGARSRAGDVLIENSGALTAADGWAAIAAESEGGNIAVRNSGAITVTGRGAGGIEIGAYDGTSSQTADVRNSGDISLQADNQRGIHVESRGHALVENSGRIQSSNVGAHGIDSHTDSPDAYASSTTTVRHSGEIALSGSESQGILATTNLGSIDVQSSGDIRATGAHSYGIFAVGVSGGTTRIDIAGGTVEGGSGSTTLGTANIPDRDGTTFTVSAGIVIAASDSAEILNSGTITARNGLAIAVWEGAATIYEWDDALQQRVPVIFNLPAPDTAITNRAGGLIDGMIRLGSGNDSIDNAGRITGDIDMGGGANVLSNLAGGTLSGANIAVGAGNTFTNAGILSPGGTGTIAHTTVVGNFVQAVGGRMVIDINETADTRSDTISVTGSASLAGFVTPNVVNLNNVIESEYQVLTAAGGITDNGVAADPARARVTDTVGYDFGLEQRDNAMFLTATRQSSPTGIASDASTAVGATGAAAGNFAALGGALEAAENGGNTSLTPVLNAIRLSETSSDAATVMDRLMPQQQGEQAGSATRSSTSFGNSMLSCATREGQYAYTREGKCYYAKLTLRRLDHDASSAGAGVTETGTEAMGGIQFDVGGERRLGLAFGYEDITSKSFSTLQTLGRSEGQRFQGGLVLKDQWGPINAYLNVTGSYTDVDGRRHVNMGGFTDARYDQEVMSGLVKLRLSYLHDMGAWYVKPLVDLGANYIHLGGYSEAGAGAFNLSVAATDKWLLSIMPGVEVGGEVRDGSGTIWRPYVRAGVTFYNDDTINVTTRFTEAPATIAGFNVATRLDTIYADIDAGMHILTASGLNLRFNYEGRYGESTRQHAGTVKVSLPY